jgi:hypothetical protein
MRPLRRQKHDPGAGMKIRTIYGRGKYVYGRSKVLICRRVSITGKISIGRSLDLVSMSQAFGSAFGEQLTKQFRAVPLSLDMMKQAVQSIKASAAQIVAPQYPTNIDWDAEFSFSGKPLFFGDSITFEVTPMNSTRIKCPTCGAVVGQRDADGTEIVEWNHIGPCGAPCAGKRFRGCRRQRNSTDGLHTKRACPRCAPQTCPSCNNVCMCRMCKGTGEKESYNSLCGCRFGWGVRTWQPDRSSEEYLPAGVTSCKHSCKRCNGAGKVHGLEAAA